MGFFGWFILVVVGIWLTFRIFGRQILMFGARQMKKKLEKHMQEQAQQYNRAYNQDPYHDHIPIKEDVEINIPKNHQPKRGPNIQEVAEDVEFEEVRD